NNSEKRANYYYTVRSRQIICSLCSLKQTLVQSLQPFFTKIIASLLIGVKLYLYSFFNNMIFFLFKNLAFLVYLAIILIISLLLFYIQQFPMINTIFTILYIFILFKEQIFTMKENLLLYFFIFKFNPMEYRIQKIYFTHNIEDDKKNDIEE